MYYLAYGSNLNKAQMAVRCPDAVPVLVTKICDYALVFRRGYLTIEPRHGASVPVAVWEISDRDEASLDRYEGFPRFYRKAEFIVPHVGNAVAYVMNNGFPVEMPTVWYLRTVVDGYKDFGISLEPLLDAYMDAADTTSHTTKR